MRVLYLSPSNRLLGARKSLIDLVTAIQRIGVEAMVVCPGDGDLARELRSLDVETRKVRHYPWRKAIGHLQARFLQLPELRRIVQDFRPDVIHANEYHIVPQGVECAAGRQRVPTAVHVRNLPAPSHLRKYRLDECDAVITVSGALKDYFAGRVTESKVTLVHNGIDLSRFHTTDRRRVPIDRTSGWPEKAVVFGLLGLVNERKNQKIALEALRRAVSLGTDARLLLAGDAFKSSVQYGEELRELIVKLGLEDRVVWLPFQDEVLPLYRAVDVNLLISREEGFGRTIIEAGAMGRPSIGTDVGGIPDIIVPGETGFLVPVNDAESLAGAMGEMSDKAKADAMGMSAAQRALNHFSIESTARGVMGVYERIAGQEATV